MVKYKSKKGMDWIVYDISGELSRKTKIILLMIIATFIIFVTYLLSFL